MTNKLSLIFLVKNEERHLSRFFKKLEGFKNYEVLINDNGAEDIYILAKRTKITS
jgi:hypothetical protein